ncbi:hypothetical protein BC937DRAFT_90237, partial [Endogone sp. FLAS-F59071]
KETTILREKVIELEQTQGTTYSLVCTAFPQVESNLDWWRCLLGKLNPRQRGDLDLGNALVEDDVVVLDEHVAEDGKGNVARVAEASNQVFGGDGESTATDRELQIKKLSGIAGDGVGAIAVVGSAKLVGQVAGDVAGKEEESGSGVNDAREVVTLICAIGGGQAVDGDALQQRNPYPEALAIVDGDGDSKDGVGDKLLADEVIDGSLDAGNGGDGVEAEAQETIDRVALERRGDGLGEIDGLALDLEATEADSVLGEDARGGGAIAILDRPRATVLLVSAALGGVVQGLARAISAASIREPQIRRAGVEVQFEVLAGGANLDNTIVLNIIAIL